MQILLVVLIIMLLVLVGGGLYLMFFRKPEGSAAASGRPAGEKVAGESIVTIRNASSRNIVIQIDDDLISGQESVPFYSDLEGGDYDERTTLERYMDPSTPPDERMAIAEELAQNNYQLKNGFVAPGGGSSAHSDSSDADDDPFGGIDDVEILADRLQSPYVDEDMKAAIRRRIATLEAAGNEDGEDNDDDGRVGGFVDPATLVSLPDEPDDEAAVETAEEQATEPAGDGGFADPMEATAAEDESSGLDPLAGLMADAEAVEAAEAGMEEMIREAAKIDTTLVPEESDGEVLEFDLSGIDPDDDADSVKTVELMTFIARSFKVGLITPELVAFAQQKLNLKVVDGLWSEERRIRARQRKAVYERDESFVNMPLHEFDLHVRSVVDAGRRGREEARLEAERQEREKADAAKSGAGRAPVAEARVKPAGPPRKAPARSRAASVFFDVHGGKRDLMWQRIERDASAQEN